VSLTDEDADSVWSAIGPNARRQTWPAQGSCARCCLRLLDRFGLADQDVPGTQYSRSLSGEGSSGPRQALADSVLSVPTTCWNMTSPAETSSSTGSISATATSTPPDSSHNTYASDNVQPTAMAWRGQFSLAVLRHRLPERSTSSSPERTERSDGTVMGTTQRTEVPPGGVSDIATPAVVLRADAHVGQPAGLRGSSDPAPIVANLDGHVCAS
jgi:hypothetical protein